MNARSEIDFESLFRRSRAASVGRQRRPLGRRFWLAALAFVLLAFASRGVRLVTDWLWFSSLEQQQVLATRIMAPLALFAAATVLGAVWLGGNWWLAARRLPAVFPGQRPLAPPGARRLALLTALAAAAVVAGGVAAGWPTVLLYLHQVPFGLTDPHYGRDVAFYVFTVPALRLAQQTAVAWLVLAAGGAALLYAAGGLLRLGQRKTVAPRAVRAHLFGLLALWSLAWSAGMLLARFEALSARTTGGGFTGAGHTAATITLPAYTAVAAVGVVAAGLLIVTARSRHWWLPFGVLAAALVLRAVLVDAAPALVQRYRVQPDEFAREAPYIERAIHMTRRAYGVDGMVETSYDPVESLSAELLEAHADTVANVRLWDWSVLLQQFQQLQEIRTYYRFLDVDVDRYDTSDGQRQVMLALREMDQTELRNPTWVNRRLQFTHGFGAVVAPVDEVDARGQAVFWARDIPVRAREPFDVELLQPRIYFGQAQDDRYVVVQTKEEEFDYPMGQENARNRYDGADGVRLSSRLRRLLFALRFGEVNLLVSEALGPESRILLHRNITDRVRLLAPFLDYDEDPYPVITADGRIVWIYDAYTSSERYPYAQRLGATHPDLAALTGINYVRNSVKVAIDAYDGRPRFHIVDPSDPVVAAWASVFPTLFERQPMTADLQAHWRYPETLFRVQAEILLRYHMTDPFVFYNAEDLWAVPTETRGQGERALVQPYYVTMRLRDGERAEFVLILPFSPARKDLMVAWLAARSDPPHYGQLVLYRFAKGIQIDGPQLVESRIDNDTEISAQLTLWSQTGSQTIRGNLLAIPIQDAMLYVEPLFLRADTRSLPELKRVIAATKDRVAMEETLDRAIQVLLGLPAAQPGAAPAAAPRALGVAPPPGAPDPRLEELVRSAGERERAAREALGRGDWSAFGREMTALQRVLDDLALRVGPTPTAGAVPPAGEGEDDEAGPAPVGTPEALLRPDRR